ncbi:F-box-like domain superfamily [Sesbania bispinosa]|nr:F-box-like domain superfamily [Sesbania bispinosa]
MTTPPPPIIYKDLIIEILSWLPVKSLLRFKCVSKFFKSVISDTGFIKLHLQRSPRDANILFKWKGRFKHCTAICSSVLNNPSFNIVEDLGRREWDPSEKHSIIHGSCNGLICVVVSSPPKLSNEEYLIDYQFYLWNPATRLRSQKSPCLSIPSSISCPEFGFGYDSLSDTYKVVAIFCYFDSMDESVVEMKVYNIGDNCWRDIIQNWPILPCYIERPSDGVYVSNSLNWIYVLYGERVILSLDLGKETCRPLLLPCGVGNDHAPLSNLGVLKDCLCLSYNYLATEFVVWQMKEYGVENSWTQLLRINYTDHPNDWWVEFTMYPLLRILDNGDVFLIATHGYGSTCGAVFYHKKSNKVENVKISRRLTWIYHMDYVQSLVSP